MTTTYSVTTAAGHFTVATLAEVRTLVANDATATVKAVVTVNAPCDAHPAYEATNCPVCGTSARIA